MNPPPTPIVGVNPNPTVVLPLNSALVLKRVISSYSPPGCPISVGSQMLKSTSVEELDFAKIPYTFRKGNTQTSGLTLTTQVSAVALLKRTISSRLCKGPLLKPIERLSITISDLCHTYWELKPAEYGKSNPSFAAFFPQIGSMYGYSVALILSLSSTFFWPTT